MQKMKLPVFSLLILVSASSATSFAPFSELAHRMSVIAYGEFAEATGNTKLIELYEDGSGGGSVSEIKLKNVSLWVPEFKEEKKNGKSRLFLAPISQFNDTSITVYISTASLTEENCKSRTWALYYKLTPSQMIENQTILFALPLPHYDRDFLKLIDTERHIQSELSTPLAPSSLTP
jgi:hypothetical protein